MKVSNVSNIVALPFFQQCQLQCCSTNIPQVQCNRFLAAKASILRLVLRSHLRSDLTWTSV